MFAQSLHNLLAWLSLVGMGGVAVEAAIRTVRVRPSWGWLSRVPEVMLLLVVATAAAGLALLAAGQRPREYLHFIYAALALGAVPIADGLASRWSLRRTAVARLVGALIGLGVILRLFNTG
jgi:hypothetical protein